MQDAYAIQIANSLDRIATELSTITHWLQEIAKLQAAQMQALQKRQP